MTKLTVERTYLVRRIQTITVEAPEGFDLATYDEDWDLDQHACDRGEFGEDQYDFLDDDDLRTRVTHVDGIAVQS